MLTLELFSYLSKIPYDAYATQSNSDWLFVAHQENCELIGLRMKVERNFHINMPYYSYLKSKPFASKIEDLLRHTVITFTEIKNLLHSFTPL